MPSGNQGGNFQKLLAKIEMDAATTDLLQDPHLLLKKHKNVGLFPFSRSVRHSFGLAAACLSFLIIGGLSFLTLNTSETAFIPDVKSYHTLSDTAVDGIAGGVADGAAAGVVGESGKQFRVLFHRDTTDTQIQLILANIDAQMTSGPSPRGVYTIQVSPNVKKSVEEILAVLRTQTQVVLVEPVIE
jgi:hypothetical protein